MKVLLVSLLLSVAIFVGGAYQRYDSHTKRIAELQGHLGRVYVAISKSSQHHESRFRKDYDGFVSAINSLNGQTSFADIAALARMSRRIQKVQREQSQFDRDVAEYEQHLQDNSADHQLDKVTAGVFEQYNHSSDALRDSLIGMEGAFKAAQTNPYLIQNDGDPLGKGLDKTAAAYLHNMNMVYYGEANDIDDYKKQEKQLNEQLQKLQSEPFWT